MARIRETLDTFGLLTEPDFQSVWPDTQVSVKLKAEPDPYPHLDEAETFASGPTPSEGHQRADEQDLDSADPAVETLEGGSNDENKGETLNSAEGTGLVEVSTKRDIDPVVRVSSIPSAGKGLVSVLLDDPLEKATTRMMFGGFSQLAIMQGDREARGIISWESIAKRSMTGSTPKVVSECRIDAPVIDADASLYDALPTITNHSYVLVRSKDRKLVGIVTATDLSAEFGKNAYAFMSLRTIEITIRGKLHPLLAQSDLDTLESHSKARSECDPAYLTFGENVRLLQNDYVWRRLSINVDKQELLTRLLEIRDIRNDVMHFDPDPLSENKASKLDQMERFLKQVFV